MIDRKRIARFRIFAALLVAASGSAAVRAEDPATTFLEALRGRGYYDTALDYLKSAETSEVVPAFFKAQIPYERGLTMVELAAVEANRDLKIKLLKEAEAHLDEFLTKNSASPLVPSARKETANILIAQARLLVRDAKGTDQAKLAEADKLYAQAYQSFQAIREDLKKRLEAIPKVLNDNDRAQRLLRETRDQYRQTYQAVRLLSAVMLVEQAEITKENKAEYEKRMNQAIAELGQIYTDYRIFYAGFQAKVFQADAYLKMGRYADAIAAAKEVLEQEDPGLRSIKIQALAVAAPAWNHESIKQYDETVNQVGAMLDTARPAEEREPDFLRMKLSLAKALKARAEASANPTSSDAKKDLRRAKAMSFQVSNVQGDLQKEARELLVALGGPDAAAEEIEPTTFVEAQQAGRDAFDVAQSSEATLKTIQTRLKEAGGNDAELQQQVEALTQTVAKARGDAVRYFRDALRLAGPDEDPASLGRVRYFLTVLYYGNDDLHAAGVMGEFVARRTSEDPTAPYCGRVALAAYKKLFDEADESLKDFYLARTESVATFVGEAFKGQPEAAAAIATLIPMQLQAGKIEEALALLQQIPLDSPLRAQMDLLVGQIAWAEYLRGGAKVRELETAQAPAEEIAALQMKRDALKQTALTTLEGGVGRMQTAKYGKTEALAVIFLAQILVGSDRAQDAVALLEDPEKGVLPKLAGGNADIEPKIAAEAYKVALRSYVSSIVSGANANDAIEKAKQTMDALDGAVAEKKTLISIYISVAQDLQKQLENAPPNQREALSKAFAAFLEQVRGEAQQLDVLVWVAETFYGIAQSAVGPDGVATPAAKGYYEQAQGAYAQILSMGKNKGGDWLPKDVERTVEMKLAMIDRELGDYQGAIARFERVLAPNNSVLNVQTEAAETLMKWGQQDPQQYFSAIMGARKDPKTQRNVIWGWTRLSSVARQNAKPENDMMETFFLARLRMAEALRGYALASKDAAQKKKHLELAEKSIVEIAKAMPTMGGADWRRKFDDVLKAVQKDLGKPTDGLSKVLPPPAPETASR
ncbi:MAG TPA: hypothetical protein VGN57_01170 [Pirellulaceae bacterium]|jgi:hypothetical protein|nr:hypothetical protein [Pirellulaceae bacterium]